VSDDEVARLYRTASCLVFPSLYEGFGLPVVEAMASGCPVATSYEGALAEVCGDDAVRFEATDPASIAAGIMQAIAGSAELAARGRARAAEFSWDMCVQAHIKSYLAAVG
jgi:glycosyltransferase involved in cell wall biosynthesis